MYETLLKLFIAFILIAVLALIIKKIKIMKNKKEIYVCTECSDIDCICHKSDTEM
jgi:hypothetical protein